MVLYQGVNEGNLVSMAQAAAGTERIPYGLLLARLGQEATARFRRSVRPLNLGAQQFIVLKQLEALGPCSQSALADALGIDYSNLASVTGELYRRELIGRNRDESDRRRYVVELTPAGRQLLADADNAVGAGEEDMLSVLDAPEREQLWELLRRIADSLELCPSTEAEACTEAAIAADQQDDAL
jgi:DNA-binding MarR family transcriptional regulator